ncbi:hypothetical protein HID58_071694 [Brassica napus]|uniref:Uncharacterized protein n=1 Tax=Brassica napus TaxID=3708 RepID=A0ABQ7Z2C7_BRANA|nr:hypothetical protein HID58_071694 [Brassica napus]
MSVHSPCKVLPSSASSLSKVSLSICQLTPPFVLRCNRHTSPLCSLWSDGVSGQKL